MKSSSSPARDAVLLLARMPWWLSLVLAVVSYLALHWLSAPWRFGAFNAGGSAQLNGMLGAVAMGIAHIAQYIVPFAFVTAAGIAASRRRHRVGLLSSVARSSAPAVLDNMSWHDFELLVGEAFRRQGFQVAELGGGGADGGVDLVLHRDGEKFLVQCKQWKALKVSVAVVRELLGVMAASGAAGGYVVTSGTFTKEAAAFASGRNIYLIDGGKLVALIREARQARPAPASDRAVISAAVARPGPPCVQPTVSANVGKLECPICAGPMAQRLARRGANAGGVFWGCQNYPACKGTRQA